MDEQTNDQVQVVCQDVEGLKDQLAKILELLTTGRGKSVAGISSQVEVDMNQVLEDITAYPLDVVIPPKFKIPDFEKYNGTMCPKKSSCYVLSENVSLRS
ncbi:uncharacterized protein E5676_scaffold2044G00270 [Cucumis melo var. makuwa]|uniref:Gag-pro-like protein n=1 Tax=Cucumis melo var. makuwa TaxID=1194695 RepID=A0A5D3BPT8_CUCMM|nr:uncharacterized protein E5676_scaffold2044G00270 [Cucumis melo var. makuwa]